MMTKPNRLMPYIFCASLLANALVVYFLYTQVDDVRSLQKDWQTNTSKNLTIATHLAQLEREIGYNGFIHHFKNFIIRGEQAYFDQAQTKYFQAKASIESLKQLLTSQEDLAIVSAIEVTFDDYFNKLQTAHTNPEKLTIEQLDKIVKVDDSLAGIGLDTLRSHILPNLKYQQNITEKEVSALSQKTIIMGLAIVPFFVLFSILIVRLVKNLSDAYLESNTIFNTSPDGIIYVDQKGKIIKANNAMVTMFGYEKQELQSLSVEDLIDEDIRQAHVKLRAGFMQKVQSAQLANANAPLSGKTKTGEVVEVELSLATRRIANEMRCVCIIKDITQQLRMQEQAERDHLTSLFNRRYFDSILNKELVSSRRSREHISLLIIDVDNFKRLNDIYGHYEGDRALKSIAEFLQTQTRKTDFLVRWGGDEFAALCPSLDKTQAIICAERICVGVKNLQVAKMYQLSLSIGIATCFSDQICTPEYLLKQADKALYQAKTLGRDQYYHIEESVSNDTVSIR